MSQYSGKHQVYSADPCIGGSALSCLFDTTEEAKVERQMLIQSHPGAQVVYWPTKAQLDKWAAEDKKLKEFEVTYFTVCHDTMQDGRRLIHAPLSASYSTKEKAEITLKGLQEQYPDAYVMQSTDV